MDSALKEEPSSLTVWRAREMKVFCCAQAELKEMRERVGLEVRERLSSTQALAQVLLFSEYRVASLIKNCPPPWDHRRALIWRDRARFRPRVYRFVPETHKCRLGKETHNGRLGNSQ